MRIIAGKHRGLRLAAVGKGDSAAHLRPTTDRVRESLFNVLMNHVDFDDLHVLDLFAGTGALGLEALSRGAAQCTFVDDGRVAQRLITQNIALTGRGADCTLLRCDATRLPQNTGAPYDLVFLDPPYGKGLGAKALLQAQKQGWLAHDALIVAEDNSAQSPAGFTVIDTRRYGDTVINLLCIGDV